jgi:alkylation response protein AidB-like acyl-CoA dehydrogenase
MDTVAPSTTEVRMDISARLDAVLPVLEEHAGRHDIDGTFVAESYEALRTAGLLSIGVPRELGGDGATIREVAAVQRTLAHHCGSTALASSMHQHVVAFTAWRYRREMPGAEATLRRVVDDGIVLVSTGGGDWTRPRGEAVKVDGGYRVSGRKAFASQVPVGTVLATMFVYDDPEQGRRVLNVAVPMTSEGLTVVETWDTLGMRGTASHDVVLDDVFVPDERVLANRPHGVIDPPLQVIGAIAFPIITAVYLGVAEAAFAAAVDAVRGRADDPLVQRQVGLMRHRLRVAAWSLDGAIDEIGDDPTPSMDGFAAAMAAKREVALAAVEVCDTAMDLAGGGAFYRGSVLERCYRDARAAKFHPLSPEATLVQAGQLALGLPGDEF